MGHLHALGLAGRAGGVHHVGEVLRPGLDRTDRLAGRRLAGVERLDPPEGPPPGRDRRGRSRRRRRSAPRRSGWRGGRGRAGRRRRPPEHTEAGDRGAGRARQKHADRVARPHPGRAASRRPPAPAVPARRRRGARSRRGRRRRRGCAAPGARSAPAPSPRDRSRRGTSSKPPAPCFPGLEQRQLGEAGVGAGDELLEQAQVVAGKPVGGGVAEQSECSQMKKGSPSPWSTPITLRSALALPLGTVWTTRTSRPAQLHWPRGHRRRRRAFAPVASGSPAALARGHRPRARRERPRWRWRPAPWRERVSAVPSRSGRRRGRCGGPPSLRSSRPGALPPGRDGWRGRFPPARRRLRAAAEQRREGGQAGHEGCRSLFAREAPDGGGEVGRDPPPHRAAGEGLA